MFAADPHQFSWLHEIGIPAFFVVLGASLGAGLSLLTSRYLEKQKAKRDDERAKKAKQSFLRVIGMELDALGDQLDASSLEVAGSTERVKSGTGVHFAAALRTSVFTSQLTKVRDADDPLMVNIIHFYSDLSTLQQVIEGVNAASVEFNRTDGPRLGAQNRLLSSLRVLQEQFAAFGKRLRDLRAKLPPARTPT